jgi:uncharacterized protein YcbK (DUF882 family)
MKQYIPKHFSWHELVPSAEYKNYWLYLIDDRILMSLDAIREHYKRPVIVNNWHSGGTFTLRGLRPMNSVVGAKYSQHKFGRAADFDVLGIPAEQVRNDIRSGLFPLITCIEKDVNWVHVDVRNCNRLLEVERKKGA